jgi:hypothetical protein
LNPMIMWVGYVRCEQTIVLFLDEGSRSAFLLFSFGIPAQGEMLTFRFFFPSLTPEAECDHNGTEVLWSLSLLSSPSGDATEGEGILQSMIKQAQSCKRPTFSISIFNDLSATTNLPWTGRGSQLHEAIT